MRLLTEVVLWALACVFFAYLALSFIGWFAFPFAIFTWAALKVRRSRLRGHSSAPASH